MSQYIESNTSNNFYKALNKSLQIYNTAGFRVMQIDCDGEFKSLMEPVIDNLGVKMNYSNVQDHVPAAE